MKLGELTSYLESIAPLRFQESYDNSGILLGDEELLLNGAMISLDCTEEVVDEAIQKNCNVVISHHPIIFSGIRKFKLANYSDRAVIKAIKNDVALYAIHTNLDNVLRSGVNTKIAEKLSLSDIEPLRKHPSSHLEVDHTLGSGLIGNTRDALLDDQFIVELKTKMNCQVVRHTRLRGTTVQRVAVCGGSGSHLLNDAIMSGADIFITADFKYHQFFDANDKIVIADIGHYESEYFTIELLFELISNKFPKFAAHCTTVNTNPVRYF